MRPQLSIEHWIVTLVIRTPNHKHFEWTKDCELLFENYVLVLDVKECAGYFAVSEDCLVVYGYKYTAANGYTVYIRDEKGVESISTLIY